MQRLVPVKPPARPLVLVGGFAANGLLEAERHHDRLYRGKQIWPPFHFDPVNGDWSLHSVSEVTKPGLIPAGFLPGQYEPLLLFLEEELGYRPGHDLFLFPYRWTESVQLSGRRLAGFLETLGFPAVDLVAHSLGGQLARVAGLLYGARIHKLALLACPFHGAGKAYFDLHPALNVQLVDNLVFNRLLERLLPFGDVDLTTTFQKMDSLFDLLPDRFAFESGLSPLQSRASLRKPPRLAESWQEAYADFPESLQPRLQQAMQLKEELGQRVPGETYLNLYSEEFPTLGRVDNTFGLFGLPYALGGGDGTVPALSATGPGPGISVPGRHLGLANHRITFHWLARFFSRE